MTAEVVPARTEVRRYAVEGRLRGGTAIELRAIRPGERVRLFELEPHCAECGGRKPYRTTSGSIGGHCRDGPIMTVPA